MLNICSFHSRDRQTDRLRPRLKLKAYQIQVYDLPLLSDESVLDDMLTKMQNASFLANFPLLNAMLEKAKLAAASPPSNPDPSRYNPKATLIKIIKGCKFGGYEALLGKCG